MTKRHILLIGALTFACLFLLTLLWEFVLEEIVYSPFADFYERHSVWERWEYILTAMVFAATAMGISTLVSFRLVSSREETERELNLSEERFRNLVEGSIQGILIHRNHRPLFVNPSWAEIFGYGVDEIMDMNSVLLLIAPQDRDRITEYRDSRMRGDAAPKTYEYQGVRKDGENIWLENQVRVVNWMGIPAVQSSLVDITERKRAEEKAMHLAVAIESLSELFALYDADDRMVLCNREHREINARVGETILPGVPFEDHLRAGLELGLYPEARGQEEAWLTERMERHRNPRGPFELARQDGRWLLIHEQKLPAGGIVTVSADITKQKQTEAALKDSEIRFRDIAESSSDWFWETDADMRFHYVSDRAFETLKIKRQDVIGATRTNVAVSEVQPAESENWKRHQADLEARRPFRNFAYTIRGNDGVDRHVEISGAPVFDDEGIFAGYRGTGTDVTELKHAAEALAESEQRHRHFAADAAHELRTPLAVLRSNLDSLEDTKAVQSLRLDVDAMSRMVEQLLAYTRLEVLDAASMAELNITDVCTKVAAYLAPLAVMDKRSIEVLSTGEPVMVLVNADALEQAVRNLVENAVRYSARKTTVTIEVDDDASIRVINRGRNIPDDTKKIIFQRFLRSDRRSGGAGLGLSIVQRAAEAHDGRVEVTDTPGGGATFILRLKPVETIGGNTESYASAANLT